MELTELTNRCRLILRVELLRTCRSSVAKYDSGYVVGTETGEKKIVTENMLLHGYDLEWDIQV